MPTPSSQGSSVTWKGVPIGRLTSFQSSAGTAVYEEVTGVESPVIGTGNNARVIKQYTCTAVEPGTLDIGVYGAPPFILDDRGSSGTVVASWDGGGFTVDAILDDFNISGRVGEFLTGTARFRFSGF